jgi:hypothetical protein
VGLAGCMLANRDCSNFLARLQVVLYVPSLAATATTEMHASMKLQYDGLPSALLYSRNGAARFGFECFFTTFILSLSAKPSL